MRDYKNYSPDLRELLIVPPTPSEKTLKTLAIQAIQDSYRLLLNERDLSPQNHKITQTLSHLVRTLTRCQCDADIARSLCDAQELATEKESLPALCAQAECEMEKYWARKLLADDNLCLHKFWYLDEYQELCAAEAGLLDGKQYSRITFLGSGALPLTALLLAQSFPDAHVTCVDFDEEACALAQSLITKAGLDSRISVRELDARSYEPQSSSELVICAALLQNAQEIYTNLQKSGCDLIVRDSEGIYRFLYRAAILPKPQDFFQVRKTSLDARRINTSRYYQSLSMTSDTGDFQLTEKKCGHAGSFA